MERTIPDVGDAAGNRDAAQIGAFKEGAIPDAGDAVRNLYTGQTRAIKHISPNAGNQQVVDVGWNGHSSRTPGVTCNRDRNSIGVQRVSELGLHRCRRGQKQQNQKDGPCFFHMWLKEFLELFESFIMLLSALRFIASAGASVLTTSQCEIPGPKVQVILKNPLKHL